MAKVTIIGASGRVGQFAAYSVSQIPFVTKIILFGREGNEDVLEGTKWDFIDSFAALGRNLKLFWSVDPKELKDSDIVIITAGIPRCNGQDRLDLAKKNADLIRMYAEMISKNAPESIIFVVSNPVDIMTAVALKYSGFPQNRVFGLGTHLDSMRLKSFVANHFQVHVSEVHTRIIGEHGNSMVPLWSATTIGGIQISNLPAFASLPKEEMVHWVKTAGSHIIAKSGATVYGPGAAIASLVKTVLGNENRILTVSAYIKSEVHDIGNVCIGVPARLNRMGAFPVPIRISEDEVKKFQESVEKIRIVTAEVIEELES
ncbi:malate dehydrogenase [Methanomicrobium antiquum]|uniref:malate dehydrogenase n=1 Tax=Methanomicrobium antiquum TaxID=487686 RepID=A0AAF0FWV7_9EURY|nr:malate dehydrogenase [Methanomicrobium antiquum]WFN36499.1 malate dehydrogenase [Methanomicrobium antiquum]